MLMNSKVYNVLKYITMIVLPALTTLWLSVGSIWQLPLVEPIGATLTAVTAFLGGILGISTSLYNIREQKKDAQKTVSVRIGDKEVEQIVVDAQNDKEETPDE